MKHAKYLLAILILIPAAAHPTCECTPEMGAARTIDPSRTIREQFAPRYTPYCLRRSGLSGSTPVQLVEYRDHDGQCRVERDRVLKSNGTLKRCVHGASWCGDPCKNPVANAGIPGCPSSPWILVSLAPRQTTDRQLSLAHLAAEEACRVPGVIGVGAPAALPQEPSR